MKINVYEFCRMMHECKEIRLHIWDKDNNDCSHFTVTDWIDLYDYRDTEVIQFKAMKKGVIDIIAGRV